MDTSEHKPGKSENDWFDRPESRKLLWRLLCGACIVSVLFEVVVQLAHLRHGHFGDHSVDGWWFFYAILGFVACTLMILAAKGLGFWLKRPDDYFGEPEEESLPEDIDESLR